MVSGRDFAASNHQQMRRQGDADRRGEPVEAKAADWKPASGIEQVARVIANVSQLEPRNRAVFTRFERAFIFETQSR